MIENKKHYWEAIRENVDKSDKILDIGIGDGNTWKMGKDGIHNVVGSDGNYNVTGVDLDDIEVDSRYKFVQANICDDLPFSDNEFDVCVLSQVLEHLPDINCMVKAISEAMRVAKKKLIVTVPIGSQSILETNGDECAKNNTWIKYKKFIPDSEFTHHTHVRAFESEEKLMDFYNNILSEIYSTKGVAIIKAEYGVADGSNMWGMIVISLDIVKKAISDMDDVKPMYYFKPVKTSRKKNKKDIEEI